MGENWVQIAKETHISLKVWKKTRKLVARGRNDIDNGEKLKSDEEKIMRASLSTQVNVT